MLKMKLTIVSILILFLNVNSALSQQLTVQSPNQKILVSLFDDANGTWMLYMKTMIKNLYCGYMDCAHAGEKVIN